MDAPEKGREQLSPDQVPRVCGARIRRSASKRYGSRCVKIDDQKDGIGVKGSCKCKMITGYQDGMSMVTREKSKTKKHGDDIILWSFMNLLAFDMKRSPKRVGPLNTALVARINSLIGDVRVTPDENLGDQTLI